MASGNGRQASGVRHQASGIRRRASGVRHQAPGVRRQVAECRNQEIPSLESLLRKAEGKGWVFNRSCNRAMVQSCNHVISNVSGSRVPCISLHNIVILKQL
jgi:hypothetical protein